MNKNYIIVTDLYIHNLEDKVNRKLDEGYKVTGGLIYQGNAWYQAVVKEIE